ncbi:hypothetical protein HYR99_36710, partial [Candidatus Poribacteria bacterium]|nr:hypothetical protein [Candidatus Poribacteria bacterium]
MLTSIKNQPEQIIQERLSAVRRRIQINRLFRNLAFYGFGWLIFAGVLLITNRLVHLPIPIGFTALLAFAIALTVAVSVNLFHKTDLRTVARFVDRRLVLKERLSTALEAIYRNTTGDFSRLQIRDAAYVAQAIVPARVVSYAFPSLLKWFPIPLLLVGLSFAIPRMYEIPPPPTAAEQAAIDEAATALETAMQGIADASLAKQIRDTIKALQHKNIDVQAAADRLSKLRDEVRAQKSQLPEKGMDQAVEAISKLNEDSQRFRGKDTRSMASDLEKLAEQMAQNQLSPEEQAELEALLKKLAERLTGNAAAKSLTDPLAELQTQVVTPEMLRKIARSLLEINQKAKDIAQLERILDEIKARRKNIGLAGLEMARKTGGVANTGGGPGEESGTGEARGTQVEQSEAKRNPDLLGTSGESNFEAKAKTDGAETSSQVEQPHRGTDNPSVQSAEA